MTSTQIRARDGVVTSLRARVWRAGMVQLGLGHDARGDVLVWLANLGRRDDL